MNHMDELQQGFSRLMVEMDLDEIDAFASWFNKMYPVVREMVSTRMRLEGLEIW